ETLDFGSRNTYRNTIELLARRSPKTEVEVARAAVEMARTDMPVGADETHPVNVGSVLVGQRRFELEKALGYRPLV
ncbi:hypothetical protein, partial [Staphylococcus aureus]